MQVYVQDIPAEDTEQPELSPVEKLHAELKNMTRSERRILKKLTIVSLERKRLADLKAKKSK